MKKIIYYISLMVVLLACNDTDKLVDTLPEEGKTDQEITVNFSIYMPEQEVVQTRTAKDITSLYLLVFDENNRFVSKNKAIVGGEGVTADGIIYRDFSVVLLSSDLKRTIHFIANYPGWEEFPPSYELIDKDEGDIIPRMISTETTYWSRQEFTELSEETFSNQQFGLLRNRAKIELTKRSEIDDDTFTMTKLGVYNAPKEGTIAPFKYNSIDHSYEFTKGVLTPVLNGSSLDFTLHDYSADASSIEVFEKDNKNDNKQLFVILGAKFNGGGNTYYKIALVENEELGTLYNMIRNTIYRIVVTKVVSEGYRTPEEAINGPASNNIFASIELIEYPTISDGTAVLKVKQIGEVFTRVGQVFNTQVSYYPDKASDNVKPSAIEVTVLPHPNGENYEDYFSIGYNEGTGILQVTSKKIAQGEVKQFTVVVKTKEEEGNHLLRYVTIILRSPYSFNAVLNEFTTAQGDRVSIQFDVPKTMIYSVFPFKVTIRSTTISQDPDQEDMNIGFDAEGYYYSYNVRELTRGQTVELIFKRVRSNERLSVKLQSPYFEEKILL